MAEPNGIAFRVDAADSVTRSMVRYLKRVRDLSPVLEEIGASNLTETQHRFEQEQDPGGKPWEQLSETTLQYRLGAPPRILRDQGNLYDSLTYKVVPHREVRVGTNLRYARIHQLGGQAGRGRRVKIPARPYLGLSEDGARELLAIVTDHLERP